MYKIGIDDNYKNNIYTNDAIHSLVIKINNNIIDSKYVRKLQKQHDILAGEKLSIGSACSQCITLQLDYDALNNIQEINEVYIEENVIIGDSTYKIPLGYFYLSNNGIDSTNKAYATLKLYDKLYTLNIPYSTSSEFIENNNKTRLQIVQDICAKNGMYLETTNFLGYDKIDNVYNDDMTYQNWLVFISERAGGFCRVGREKNSSGLIPLSIISLADLETNIIPNNMLGNFVEGNTFTISKVATSIITNYGDDTGTTIFLSADNILPLTNNDVEEIYNKIKNVTFQNFEVKTWGDSTIDAGDFIQIGDYKTIAEIDMDYANGYYGTYKFNKQLPESDTEIVKIQSSGNKRYTKKRIEELENGYKFVVQSVETLEKEVTTIKETSGNNSLYVEDALESRVLEYGIDGKSEQDGTPTPDTPVEIKSVEGIRNLFDSLKGTSTTKNGMTITCTENSIILNGTTTAIANFWFDNLNIPLKKGAISFSTNVNLDGKGVYVWKENSTNILQTNNSANITLTSDKTITQFLIQINSGVTFNNQEFKILLAEDNVSTYVPYGSWLRVQTTGKNLFDISNNPIEINTYYDNNGNLLNWKDYVGIKDYVPVQPNQTYIQSNSLGLSFTKVIFFDKNKNVISQGFNLNIINTPSNAYFIKFGMYSVGDVIPTWCQIEKGTTATDYEQYKENISLIDLKDNELCSIGDIKDNLIVNPDGTATIEKKIGKLVLDGSENWVKGGSSFYCNSFVSTNKKVDNNTISVISNCFKGDTFNNIVAGSNQITSGNNDSLIRITYDISKTLEQFKSALNTMKPTMYYQLEEPYTIELGQVDISLFENINHINLVDDIETDTRVKYLINNVMNGTYATKGELELTNEQFQTTITNEFNSLERQMSSITQTGGAIDLAIQSSKDYTDSKNESLDNRITNSENNYNDLNNKYNTLNGKITDMNFSFKTDGLTIGTSGSEINSKLDNKGLKIYNISTLIAIFNQNGSGFGKLIVTESIQLQNLFAQKRVINTPKADNMEVVSVFFNKSLIENLTDLESD